MPKRPAPSFILVLVLIDACSQTEALLMDVDTLICSEWALAEIGGQPVVDRVQSTLRFQSADRIIGWGVCNRYFEGLRSQEDIIEIGPIGSTRRVCPPVAMYQEVRFF